VLIVCVAALAYLAVMAFWQSDKRKVMAVVRAIAVGMEEGSTEDVLAHVSPYFSEEGVSKGRLERSLKRAFRRRNISRLKVSIRQIDVAHARASATVHVVSYHDEGLSARFARSEWWLRFARSEWWLRLEKIGERWLVREARPVQVNGRRVAGLRAVLVLGS
jgi:hypothetical protein